MRTGGSQFLRIWAVVMILIVLVMGSLALFTFGAVCFSGLFFLWFKEKWQKKPSSLDIVNGIMLFLCVIWFVVNIGTEFARDASWQFFLMFIAFLFPPLLFHIYYLEGREYLSSRRIWKLILGFLYVVSLGFAILGLAVFLVSPQWVDFGFALVLIVAMAVLFTLAGVAGALVVAQFPTRREEVIRRARRMNIMLLAAMAAMFIVVTLAALASPTFVPTGLSVRISLLSRGMPLVFLFVNSYYESRFEFFDVFVKRATLFFLILIGLVGFFAFVPPRLAAAVDEASVRPWVFALILAPAVMAVPSLYHLLESWLDRHWLGRTLTSVDAVKAFFEAVGNTSRESELVREAEVKLGEIFRAEAQIAVGETPDPGFRVAQRIPIRLEGGPEAEIRLGLRPNNTPYFAQDLTLITALSDVLGHLWKIMELQRKRQEQETREQELTLQASRSHLKALRAQINPHFLFNALNVIASLVHRDPDRAEATVEQLAEVFRYTLSQSDQEWVRLSDEMEFIRSYLEVEKARFGEHLQIRFEVEPEVLEQAIPSMMVQTLVENAFKHGLSSVRGVGRIEIRAALRNGLVEIEVADNGPGVASPADQERKRGGYGLKNIASRLEGYYKGEATLNLARDEVRGLTVARLSLPASGNGNLEQRRRA